MWIVYRVTNELTSFVDEQNNAFAMSFDAGIAGLAAARTRRERHGAFRKLRRQWS